jgi:hypothetical protein
MERGATVKLVLEFLKSDRQWRRVDRVAHYQYQLARAYAGNSSSKEVDFWRACLEAVQ